MNAELLPVVHPNLKQMSHSSIITLHHCPRKYELEKLGKRLQDWGEVHLDFGHVVGEGVQEYFITRSRDAAMMKVYMGWQSGIDEGAEEGREKSKKTFWHALHAVDRFISYAETYFGNFEIAILNGRPAVELGFCIDCGDGYVYRGYIDAVLIDRVAKRLVVLENKTTGSWNVNEASYKNSGQGLGYMVLLDIVAEALGMQIVSDYPVYYPVYKTMDFDWEIMQFSKSKTARAKWIRSLLLDKSHIQQYAELEYFPMHGESCMNFNKQCEYFGVCELSNASIIGTPVERIEKAGKYDYYFSLDDLIQQQLAQLEG